ncbi:Ubiquitin-like protein SMT3 [Cladophialophora carrionii]|uniref:Ubiquitin-like protein SMT3 n=1 Tax=Cladophialophora carrionii TaxID=86049 RepID=A0A1C1CUI6_9EURO|nr:Ubiquitin-like protein SMT3 [Cladophialophora carrionii]
MDAPAANPEGESVPPPAENIRQLEIKVTDGNNELVFKVKGSTKLGKVVKKFCDYQGKEPETVKFLFDGERIRGGETPDDLEMENGDIIEMKSEQIGGWSK